MTEQTFEVQTTEIPPNLIVMRVAWAMMVFSVLLAIILSYAPATDSDSIYASPAAIRTTAVYFLIFSAVASIFALFLSAILPRILTRLAVKRLRVSQMVEAKASVEIFSREMIVQLTTVAAMSRMILTESVVFFGLFSVLVGRDPKLIYPFAAVAIFAMSYAYPSDERLKNLVQRSLD